MVYLRAPRGASRARIVEHSDGKSRLLAEIDGTGAVASLGATWVAYVTGGAPNEDFIAEPELELLHLESGDVVSLGPGFAPLWHPNGQGLAWLRPVEERVCSEETCSGEVEVWSARAGEQGRRRIAPGRWSLISWAGDQVVVADASNGGRLHTADADGDLADLGLVAPQLWDTSPDGRWMVTVHGRRTSMAPMNEDGERLRVDIDGWFGEGAWAPDGGRLAAAVIGSRRGPDRLAVLDAGVTKPSIVPESRGAAGGVVWAPTGESFAYARAAGRHLEALLCTQSSFSCREVLQWRGGVTLLALR